MAISTVGGSSANGSANGGFDWHVDYDDVAHTATAFSAGVGRCTVVVAQSNGQRAKITFAASGDQRPVVAVPADIEATVNVTRAVVIGTPLVVSPVTLKPFPPVKPGGVGGFEMVCEYYQP